MLNIIFNMLRNIQGLILMLICYTEGDVYFFFNILTKSRIKSKY